MIKATELRGKAVVALDTAHKIGEVDSLYIKPEEQKVVGIRVRSRQYNDRLAIAAPNIHSIGQDAVTITSNSLLQHPTRIPELAHVPALEQIEKARVVTESGKLLGQISDVYIDAENCEITKYELEGSFWENLTQNKHTFVARKGMQFGTNILVVPDEVEAQLGREPARAEAQQRPPAPPAQRSAATPPQPETRVEQATTTPEQGRTTQIPAQGAAPLPTGNEARRNELLDEQRRLQQRMEEDRRRLEELQVQTRQTLQPTQAQRPEQPPQYGGPPQPTGLYVPTERAETRPGLPEMPAEPAAQEPPPTSAAEQQRSEEERILEQRIAEERQRLEDPRAEEGQQPSPPSGT
ncbi:MAG: PRC-barrel domain-containing protein [Candidatus Marsarchaeota archaeon]|nr:PRC-barrel domain-containing protein [Candidatus Marsarchaeota archaeon]